MEESTGLQNFVLQDNLRSRCGNCGFSAADLITQYEGNLKVPKLKLKMYQERLT